MRTMWPICKYAHSMSGHLNPPSRRGAGQLHHPQWDTARPFWPGDWTSWPHRPVHLLMPLVHHSWSRLFPSLSFKRNENSLSHPLLLAACLVAWTELEKFYTHTSHTHTLHTHTSHTHISTHGTTPRHTRVSPHASHTTATILSSGGVQAPPEAITFLS